MTLQKSEKDISENNTESKSWENICNFIRKRLDDDYFIMLTKISGKDDR